MPFDDLQLFQNRLILNGWRDGVPVSFIRGDALTVAKRRPGYTFGALFRAAPSAEPGDFKLEFVLCPLSVSGPDSVWCERAAADALRIMQDTMPVKHFVSPGLVTIRDAATVCTTIYACVPRAAISGYQALWRELISNAMPPHKVVDSDFNIDVE